MYSLSPFQTCKFGLMRVEEVQSIIENCIPDSSANVVADGNKYEATVISEAFEGLTMLKAHQMVNVIETFGNLIIMGPALPVDLAHGSLFHQPL